MKAIHDLLQHSEFRVRELGQKAVQYRNQLERAEISRAEYDNLVAQLTDLDALNQLATTEDERQALAKAVQFLATFLQAVL